MLHLTCVCHQLAVARTNEEMFKTKLVREDARYVELNRLLTQAYTKVIAAGLNPAGMSGAPWCAWRESQGWLKLLFFKESWAELVLRLTYGKIILWKLIGWNRRPSYSKQGSPNGTDVIQIRHFCDHSRFICSLSNLNNHPPSHTIQSTWYPLFHHCVRQLRSYCCCLCFWIDISRGTFQHCPRSSRSEIIVTPR